MAKGYQAFLQGWQNLLGSQGGTSMHLSGHDLSRIDSENCRNAIALWAITMTDFSSEDDTGVGRQCSNACMLKWACRLFSEDIGDIITKLKNLTAVIRNWQPHMGCCSLRSFKHFLAENTIDITEHLYDPIRGLLYRYAIRFNHRDFWWLNTFCQFIQRLTLHDVGWIEKEMIQKYYDEEEQALANVYDENLLREINAVLRLWLQDLDIGSCLPRHSNGATNVVKRGQGIAMKYAQARHTAGTQMFQTRWDVDGKTVNSRLVERQPWIEVEQPVLKGQLVPKGIDKKRFISMEHTMTQYYQNQVWQAVDNVFKTNPSIGVSLEHQEFSRDLTLECSRSGRMSTIDLSSASDSITWTFAKKVFRGTKLYPALVMLRTRDIDIPGSADGEIPSRRMRLEKLFGMGSSLCFPVECLIFAAIAHVACKHMGLRPDYRVYGDDIIIDTRAFHECCSLLEACCFKVNDEKSFGSYSLFLESCGIEALQGYDVTPFRISRWFDWHSSFQYRRIRSADGDYVIVPRNASYLGMVDMANRAYSYGLRNVRSWIISNIVSVFPDTPFSKSNGIWTVDPSNYRLKTRYNRSLQRLEYRIIQLKTTASDSRGGHGAYLWGKGELPLPSFEQYVQYTELLKMYHTTTRVSLSRPEDRIDAPVTGTTISSFGVKWDPLLDAAAWPC